MGENAKYYRLYYCLMIGDLVVSSWNVTFSISFLTETFFIKQSNWSKYDIMYLNLTEYNIISMPGQLKMNGLMLPFNKTGKNHLYKKKIEIDLKGFTKYSR